MAISLLIAARSAVEPQHAYVVSGGYRPGGRHKVVSAALSLTALGLVGAGLVTALVVPDLVKPFVEGTWVHNVPVETDPLPEPPDRTRERQAQSQSRIETVPPLVNTPPMGPTTDYVPQPLPPLTPSVGEIETGPLLVTPVPPVIRAPSRNTRFIADFQPPYPAARQREQVEGNCRVSVAISAQGRVTAVSPIACPDDAFFRATERQALRSWRFNPGTRDGTPVASQLEQNVIFRMPE